MNNVNHYQNPRDCRYEPVWVDAEKATEEKGYPHPGSYVTFDNNSTLHFQYGHPGEVGDNGVHVTEVLDMLIERLKVFQSPRHPMSTRETAVAITKLQEARMWIEERKRDRGKRGVFQTDKA